MNHLLERHYLIRRQYDMTLDLFQLMLHDSAPHVMSFALVFTVPRESKTRRLILIHMSFLLDKKNT